MPKALFEPIESDEDNKGVDEDGVCDESNEVKDNLINNESALRFESLFSE